MRRLPSFDGSNRAGPGELRRPRPLAHRRQRRRHRYRLAALRRVAGERDGGAAPGGAQASGSVHAESRREPHDLCARARRRVLRHAVRAGGAARRRPTRLQVLVTRARHREERAVPEEEVGVMMITGKAIARRAMLRGIGATVALPLLDAMIPAASALARTTAKGTPRFGFFYVPHGSIMRQWTRAQGGKNFEFSPILKPLERFREYTTVLSNLANYGEAGHSASSAMWMGGTFPSKGSVLKLSTTADQIIAQHIGRDSTFPSMEFATEDHSSHLGSCAGDFLCSYMSTISWASATQPLPMEINPRVVFERMFGGDRATPEERRARLRRNTSILDAVAESARELRLTLGPRDRV